MPKFEDHIHQANHNLKFLEYINRTGTEFYDWQVTACFYAAVHLVNAHLSVFGMQYRKHVDVKDALNPKRARSIQNSTYLPEKEYLAYSKLQSLSRRSRYLVNERDGNLQSENLSLTYDVHLRKSLKHLNTLIGYFSTIYEFKITAINISCEGIQPNELCFSQQFL